MWYIFYNIGLFQKEKFFVHTTPHANRLAAAPHAEGTEEVRPEDRT